MTKQKLRDNVSEIIYGQIHGRPDSIVDEAIEFATFHALAFARWCTTLGKEPNKYHWKQYAKNNGIIDVIKANWK